MNLLSMQKDLKVEQAFITSIDKVKGRVGLFLKNGLSSTGTYMYDINDLRVGISVLVSKVDGFYVIINRITSASIKKSYAKTATFTIPDPNLEPVLPIIPEPPVIPDDNEAVHWENFNGICDQNTWVTYYQNRTPGGWEGDPAPIVFTDTQSCGLVTGFSIENNCLVLNFTQELEGSPYDLQGYPDFGAGGDGSSDSQAVWEGSVFAEKIFIGIKYVSLGAGSAQGYINIPEWYEDYTGGPPPPPVVGASFKILINYNAFEIHVLSTSLGMDPQALTIGTSLGEMELEIPVGEEGSPNEIWKIQLIGETLGSGSFVRWAIDYIRLEGEVAPSYQFEENFAGPYEQVCIDHEWQFNSSPYNHVGGLFMSVCVMNELWTMSSDCLDFQRIHDNPDGHTGSLSQQVHWDSYSNGEPVFRARYLRWKFNLLHLDFGTIDDDWTGAGISLVIQDQVSGTTKGFPGFATTLPYALNYHGEAFTSEYIGADGPTTEIVWDLDAAWGHEVTVDWFYIYSTQQKVNFGVTYSLDYIRFTLD